MNQLKWGTNWDKSGLLTLIIDNYRVTYKAQNRIKMVQINLRVFHLWIKRCLSYSTINAVDLEMLHGGSAYRLIN